jgi:hypothetical protein
MFSSCICDWAVTPGWKYARYSWLWLSLKASENEFANATSTKAPATDR